MNKPEINIVRVAKVRVGYRISCERCGKNITHIGGKMIEGLTEAKNILLCNPCFQDLHKVMTPLI